MKQLVSYLPYGLKFILTSDKREDFAWQDFYENSEIWNIGAIWELIGINNSSELNIPLGEGYLDGMLLKNQTTYANFKHDIKPIFHPLSDLTKEIEHNGEKFVPIINIMNFLEIKGNLFEVENGIMAFGWVENYLDDSQGYAVGWSEKNNFFGVCYSEDINSDNGVFFEMDLRGNSKMLYDLIFTYDAFQLLLEWHFDVFGLIKKGLAIDINTLSN